MFAIFLLLYIKYIVGSILYMLFYIFICLTIPQSSFYVTIQRALLCSFIVCHHHVDLSYLHAHSSRSGHLGSFFIQWLPSILLQASLYPGFIQPVFCWWTSKLFCWDSYSCSDSLSFPTYQRISLEMFLCLHTWISCVIQSF